MSNGSSASLCARRIVGLAEGVSIPQFVKHVRVGRSYLCYDNLRLLYLSLDVLKNDSWTSLLIYTDDLESRCFCLVLDDLPIEAVIGFGELHYNERSVPITRDR